MTIQQLSARSVKVHIHAEELRTLMISGSDPESMQILDLIGLMLTQAEAFSRIPFSVSTVSVEILTDSAGGLTAYFSLERQAETVPRTSTLHLSAAFPDKQTIRACCRRFSGDKHPILGSTAYQYKDCWILILKLMRSDAAQPYHLLLEYGRPFRLTPLNRARLSEYGKCLFRRNAVEHFASDV